MKRTSLSAILASMVLGGTNASIHAQELIYDIQVRHSLNAFELFLESPHSVQRRPRLGLSQDGLVAIPGDGNFTAWRFAELREQPFVLDVYFEAPADSLDSNSGVFLLQSDPRWVNSPLPPGARVQFEEALAKAAQRKSQWGAGPFELDFFAYEVQLARGNAVAHDPLNKRTGTFYGVPIGTRDGEQQILSNFELNAGDLYHLRIVARGRDLATFLRSVRYQNQLVPVARMRTPSRDDDAVRGGAPVGLLLQTYWNNGTTAKSMWFKSIRLSGGR